MDVARLLHGIAVIIDDEIRDATSGISRIRDSLVRINIPVSTFAELPSCEIIPALASASMVILDWNLLGSNLEVDGFGDERIVPGASLGETMERDLLQFVKKYLDSVFAPLFIITQKPVEGVIDALVESKLYDPTGPNRIFVKSKGELKTENELLGSIGEWLSESPSAYTLKEWGRLIGDEQNAMFVELYKYSPNWVNIVWKAFMNDSLEPEEEFGEFLTRNLCNRIVGKYSFDKKILDKEACGVAQSGDDIRKIVESERYVGYESNRKPDQAYTGDLFKTKEGYFLNIRAQCDLARKAPNSPDYDPLLFGIEGKEIHRKDIMLRNIEITDNGNLKFGEQDSRALKEICEWCDKKNSKEIKKLNNKFKESRNSKVVYRNGTFLSRGNKVVIACVAGEKCLQFDLHLVSKQFKEIKDSRIGRIVPPYITKIQQQCAAFLIREGTFPTPEEAIPNS